MLLSIVGLALLAYGIIQGGQLGDFTRPESWATILGGLAVLAGFVTYEARSDHPALDVAYFRNRRFSASVASIGPVLTAWPSRASCCSARKPPSGCWRCCSS